MKRRIATLAATATLVLSSASALASEPNWSAGIGNGHTSSTTALNTSSKGTPASPHWTARIGTGRQSDGAQEPARESKELKQAQPAKIAGPHWTASIGTARALSY